VGSFSSIFGPPPLKWSRYYFSISIAGSARYVPPIGWWVWNAYYSSGWAKYGLWDASASAWKDSYSTALAVAQLVLTDGSKVSILNTTTSTISAYFGKIMDLDIQLTGPYSVGSGVTVWSIPHDGYGYMIIDLSTACDIGANGAGASGGYGLGDAGGGVIGLGSLLVKGYNIIYLRSDKPIVVIPA
jgi:hypothetical protein